MASGTRSSELVPSAAGPLSNPSSDGPPGRALTAEAPLIDIRASSSGDTHGPTCSAQRACALPCIPLSFTLGGGRLPGPLGCGDGRRRRRALGESGELRQPGKGQLMAVHALKRRRRRRGDEGSFRRAPAEGGASRIQPGHQRRQVSAVASEAADLRRFGERRAAGAMNDGEVPPATLGRATPP